MDLDGTLINSNEAHYNSYKIVFENIDIELLSFEEWNVYLNNKHFDDYLRKQFTDSEILKIKSEKIN